jgi:hypothetical protein
MPHPAGPMHEMGDAVVAPEEKRRGDWMQTRHGRKFWPMDPRAQEVQIDDIASHLAKMCRFNGACKWHYSVAQHSIYVSYQVPSHLALEGLLHDAAEAYCGDMIRQLKMGLPEFKRLVEAPIERAVLNRFGIAGPLPIEVKRADEAVLHSEYLYVMEPGPCQWRFSEAPAMKSIPQWSPEQAEQEFLWRFNNLWALRQGVAVEEEGEPLKLDELAKFYGVTSQHDLIAAQAKHVERLQKKLRRENIL